MARPELALQVAVTQFLALALPASVFWTSFPSGGGGRIRGALLKHSGLKAGVPDLLLIHNGHAFMVELKIKKSYLSAVQKDIHAQLNAVGCPVRTCRSLLELEATLRGWGLPLLRTIDLLTGNWRLVKEHLTT